MVRDDDFLYFISYLRALDISEAFYHFILCANQGDFLDYDEEPALFQAVDPII
jgi:hypothetical protein